MSCPTGFSPNCRSPTFTTPTSPPVRWAGRTLRRTLSALLSLSPAMCHPSRRVVRRSPVPIAPDILRASLMWVRVVVRCMMYLVERRSRGAHDASVALPQPLFASRGSLFRPFLWALRFRGAAVAAGVFPHRRPRAGHDVQVMQRDTDQSECWCYRARLSIVTMSTVDVVVGQDDHDC